MGSSSPWVTKTLKDKKDWNLRCRLCNAICIKNNFTNLLTNSFLLVLFWPCVAFSRTTCVSKSFPHCAYKAKFEMFGCKVKATHWFKHMTQPTIIPTSTVTEKSGRDKQREEASLFCVEVNRPQGETLPKSHTISHRPGYIPKKILHEATPQQRW